MMLALGGIKTLRPRAIMHLPEKCILLLPVVDMLYSNLY